MGYLDWEVLDGVDAAAFRTARPYPWVNPAHALTDEGRKALRSELPATELFRATFGMERAYGQRPHDRYELRYDSSLTLPKPWKDFIAELSGARYRRFVESFFGRSDIVLRFEWLFAGRGCSVSPHCDGLRKVGAQIFYLDDPEEWDRAWGGATLVLDDDGKMDYRSAPDFDDFRQEYAVESVGNRSLIFARGDHSWHAVRPLACPEGRMRRLFTVVVERKMPLRTRIRERLMRFFVRAS
ncbi:MAG: 2OG-Fe(II) oxygenase [Patescibacteria group bacterium]